MEFVLELQFPATSLADYDALIEMEDRLEAGLDESHGEVDGHDFGAGEMGLFVFTEAPVEAFQEARRILGEDPKWATIRAAYRPVDGDDYTQLWPAE